MVCSHMEEWSRYIQCANTHQTLASMPRKHLGRLFTRVSHQRISPDIRSYRAHLYTFWFMSPIDFWCSGGCLSMSMLVTLCGFLNYCWQIANASIKWNTWKIKIADNVPTDDGCQLQSIGLGGNGITDQGVSYIAKVIYVHICFTTVNSLEIPTTAPFTFWGGGKPARSLMRFRSCLWHEWLWNVRGSWPMHFTTKYTSYACGSRYACRIWVTDFVAGLFK